MLLHVCSFHPSTHRRWWGNTMGCYTAQVIARELKGINGHRNINMMRACDCSWLLTANMVITRLHRLPSERAYQGVQWFPSAPATGNNGRSTFEGVWWQCSLGMQRRSVHALSSCVFLSPPRLCIRPAGNEMLRPRTSGQRFMQRQLWRFVPPVVEANQSGAGWITNTEPMIRSYWSFQYHPSV